MYFIIILLVLCNLTTSEPSYRSPCQANTLPPPFKQFRGDCTQASFTFYKFPCYEAEYMSPCLPYVCSVLPKPQRQDITVPRSISVHNGTVCAFYNDLICSGTVFSVGSLDVNPKDGPRVYGIEDLEIMKTPDGSHVVLNDTELAWNWGDDIQSVFCV
jgi:hypothetical protein